MSATDGAAPISPGWSIAIQSSTQPSPRAQGWQYQSNSFSFGLFDDMVANVEKILSSQPFAVGDSFTAADTQLAAGINFTMNFLKVLPRLPVFEHYVARATDRPAFKRYMTKEAELASRVTPPPSAG